MLPTPDSISERVLAGVNVVFKPNISALSLLQW